MKCKCGEEIDFARVDFLRMTKREIKCIKCSTEPAKLCLMDYAHKTAPELVVVPNDEESKRRAIRVFNRSR